MKNIIIYFLFLGYFCASAQDNPWIIGYGGGPVNPNGVALHFSSDSINIQGQYRKMGQLEGAIAISDTLKNLLFYTNGIAICNRNHDTLPHGNDMPLDYSVSDWEGGGYPVPNSMCILPAPDNSSKYYLLHPYFKLDTIIGNLYAMRHYFSVIDMNMDNGLGDVALKNQVFQSDTTSVGSMSAVQHANGRDWWIVVNKFTSNIYYTYLLDPSGFSSGIIQVAGQPILEEWDSFGPSIFTPDGTKFIHGALNYGIRVFDFDRCTGLLSPNATFIPFKPSLGGIAVSPNSQVLYRTTFDSLFQYDLTASDVAASKQCVAVSDGFMIGSYTANFYNPGLAPNGKIYIGSFNGMALLHVIDKPNLLGSACNVIQHGVLLPMPNATVPTPPNYHLGVLSGSACDTITSYQSAVNREQVKVYPNPAKDMLYIEMPPTIQQATFGLHDITGKELLRQEIGDKATILVGKLPKGLYFYEISTHNQSQYGKVLIE